MKRKFLVVYDYGQGGLWAYVLARSAEEIKSRFPELDVFERRPVWMEEDAEELVDLDKTTVDINGPYHGLLAGILADRESQKE